jgi:hypothetical protein
MRSRPWPEVPAETARVTRSASRKGSLAIRAWWRLAGGSAPIPPNVLGRIRGLNRLELAGEAVRAALEALAAAAPGWLAGVIDASWQQVYGQRIDNLRLPESETRRTALAVQYGRDGYHLLEAVYAPSAPGWLAGLPAVQALRQRMWSSSDIAAAAANHGGKHREMPHPRALVSAGPRCMSRSCPTPVAVGGGAALSIKRRRLGCGIVAGFLGIGADVGAGRRLLPSCCRWGSAGRRLWRLDSPLASARDAGCTPLVPGLAPERLTVDWKHASGLRQAFTFGAELRW